jgi:hypothetical protein
MFFVTDIFSYLNWWSRRPLYTVGKADERHEEYACDFEGWRGGLAIKARQATCFCFMMLIMWSVFLHFLIGWRICSYINACTHGMILYRDCYTLLLLYVIWWYGVMSDAIEVKNRVHFFYSLFYRRLQPTIERGHFSRTSCVKRTS